MRRIQLMPAIAAACAGLAAWASLGSLAVSTTDAGSRFGLVPPFWLLPVLISGSVAIAYLSRLSGSVARPLLFSLVLLLPWLPMPIPPVFLLWTGHVVAGVWLTVAVGMIAAGGPYPRPLAWFSDVGRAPRMAAAAALVVYLAAGWWLAAMLPGGDEPHYLILSQSLVRDRDIQIENNHQRLDYREYFGGTLAPHFLRRGINGRIYSIHAPGLPAVVAPAYAMFGYPGVVAFLSLLAAVGSGLLWRASYLLTGSVPAAWFGWAAGALTVPFFFEAFAVYPDGLAATLVLWAALALLEDRVTPGRFAAIGAALGLLPWLHTRFAVISAALGLVLLLRLVLTPGGRSRIVPFLAAPIASAVAWFGFFYAVYGTLSPAAPYGGDTQSSPVNIMNGLPALMFDQQFGILPNAPVYGFCFVGLLALGRSRPRLAFELLAVAVPYLLSTSAFFMWWGGSSAPARFVVPVLPLLALPGAWLWASTPYRSVRAFGLATLVLSLATTAVLVAVDGGRLAYNVRDGYARAADWLNPIVDLSRGLPSFFRQAPAAAVLRAAFWIAALLVAGLGLRTLERKGATRGAMALATPTFLAVAIMCAMTGVWSLDRVTALTPESSQLNLLGRYDTRVRPNGIRVTPAAFESAESVLQTIVIRTPGHRAAPPARTLLLVPGVVPGGEYEIRDTGRASGVASLVIGRMARPIRTWDLSGLNGPLALELPVTVGSLVIDGDQFAAGSALTIRPRRIWEGAARLVSDYARHAQRYGPALAYFFDDGAFPEEPGIWVRGGGSTRIAVSAVDRGAPVGMFLRNAPVANVVSVAIDGQEQTFELLAGEERLVPIPLGSDRPAALIQIRPTTGFRPSEVEQGSTDTRFLGVWLEFR